ncbi:MAG: M28 family peptidase [Flavobacteriaceae bacterium]|nr:M28 family peptidase [Flavobacteriaceae bacterium]
MSAKKNYSAAVSFIIILFTIYWSITSLMPNRITNLDTPKNKFSTERALVHLKEITKHPHFVGTKNHKKVRNYIVSELEKLGLTVEIQTQVAINTKWRAGTNTKNILARIKGSEKGKALMILSHYDSAVHSSYGAADAGSGVVVILEGIRAYLANNPKPKNDIIILISDAEELGLLGANAFVNHHAWAKDIGLVLNFEARGSGGPSYILMETNGGNKNLIKAFNQAKVKFPVGNSLLYSIYKMLPNDTDLTVFREDGNIKGFNFAFLDDHYDYHTSQDSYERMDKNTLQHQGDYLMPLLSYFANANLENLNAEEEDVFFNFPGFVLMNYPFIWVKPLAILAVLWFLFLLITGFKKKILSVKEIFKGFIAFLFTLILSGVISFYGWKLLLKIYPQYNDILQGFTYNGHYYIAAFIALTLGISFWIYHKYFKKNSIENLLIAPIFIWLLINVAIVIYLPGAGFFIIPAFTGLLLLTLLFFSRQGENNRTILFSFLVIPILLIFAPLIQMFPIGLGLKMTVISAVLTVLVFGVILPVFASYKEVKGLSNLFFLIAILAFVSAGFTSKYSDIRKEPNSILYFLDADINKAYWASYNTKTDDFTKQFLGEDPTIGSFSKEVSASKYGTNFKLYKETEVINLPSPKVEIMEDSIIDSVRKIHMKISPQRKVSKLELISRNTLHFKGFAINGEILSRKNNEKYIFTTEKRKHVLTYYFTENEEVLDIKMIFPKDENPVFVIWETSYDLYDNPKIKGLKPKIDPRSESMMTMPFVLNDAVVIKKEITL